MHLGRPVEALREATELEAIPSLSRKTLCRLGAVHSLAAAGKNESQARRSLELLAKAKAAGYFADVANVTAIKKDEDLSAAAGSRFGRSVRHGRPTGRPGFDRF